MRNACPNCGASFEGEGPAPAKATRTCGSCGHVVVVGAPPAPAADDEPHTAPLLEPAREGDLPTSIGVAGQLLRLPVGKRVAVAVLSGERKGEAIVLTRPRLTLGRTGGGADLELPDDDVSRTHAAVECHDLRIVLRDLGSRNGTFVGPDRVGQRDVEDRTEFRIGATTLVVLVTDA